MVTLCVDSGYMLDYRKKTLGLSTQTISKKYYPLRGSL